MKRTGIALALIIGLLSCNNDAMDGNTNTDTTSFGGGADTISAAPLGDTTIDMDSSTATDTISAPSGKGTRVRTGANADTSGGK